MPQATAARRTAAFLVLVGATASRKPAASSPSTSRQAATSSATTRSATSSSGPARSGCTRPSPPSARRPRSRSAQGRRRRAAAQDASRRSRPGRSISTSPAVTLELLRAQRRRRRQGQGQRVGTAHERRHHLRALPLDGRRLARRRASASGSTAGPTPTRMSARSSRSLLRSTRRPRREFNKWGPGKYDPRHHDFDGANIVPLNAPRCRSMIPADLRPEGRRLRDRHRRWPDLVLERLRRHRPDGWQRHVPRSAHRAVDRAVARPRDPEAEGAARLSAEPRSAEAAGIELRRCGRESRPAGVRAQGDCARCHQGSTRTDVGTSGNPVLHDPADVGADATYAARSATKRYRATPLRGLFQHGPYFHDGSAKDLAAVVARDRAAAAPVADRRRAPRSRRIPQVAVTRSSRCEARRRPRCRRPEGRGDAPARHRRGPRRRRVATNLPSRASRCA